MVLEQIDIHMQKTKNFVPPQYCEKTIKLDH